jgi:hypothetical protein
VDIPSRPEDFLTDQRLAARDSETTQRHLAQWRTSADRLSRDPDTLVHFTFEDQERFDTVLRNAAIGRQADTYTAAVLGPTWTEGRWPGKSALAFREPGDRVRFEVSGHYSQLTLLASVCLDLLPANEYNALLMSENLAMGDVRWHFRHDGSLAFGLRTGPASDDSRFEYTQTPPVITDTMIGRWVSLATVLNTEAGTVAHYIDGKPAASGALDRKTEAMLGALEIGNWGIQLDDPAGRGPRRAGPQSLPEISRAASTSSLCSHAPLPQTKSADIRSSAASNAGLRLASPAAAGK